MPGLPTICAYCHPWHVKQSPSFRDLLVEPLADCVRVDVRPWQPQSGCVGLPDSMTAPVVFWQVLPPEEWTQAKGARVVWVPMWDDLWQWTQTDWDRLPRNLRVVAYCSALADCAERGGLQTLRVKYFLDPSTVEPAIWNDGGVLFYWNRTGLLERSQLMALCRALDVRKLLFRARTDPGLPSRCRYAMPERFDGVCVESIPDWLPREAFEAAVREANIVVAPRAREGVGMVMLEAMARGCAVIGLDAPTMNEYITHGSNGILLPRAVEGPAGFFVRRMLNRMRRLGHRPVACFRESLAPRIDWDALGRMDLRALGMTAREGHASGYAEWRRQIPQLARFLMEWPND